MKIIEQLSLSTFIVSDEKQKEYTLKLMTQEEKLKQDELIKSLISKSNPCIWQPTLTALQNIPPNFHVVGYDRRYPLYFLFNNQKSHILENFGVKITMYEAKCLIYELMYIINVLRKNGLEISDMSQILITECNYYRIYGDNNYKICSEYIPQVLDVKKVPYEAKVDILSTYKKIVDVVIALMGDNYIKSFEKELSNFERDSYHPSDSMFKDLRAGSEIANKSQSKNIKYV